MKPQCYILWVSLATLLIILDLFAWSDVSFCLNSKLAINLMPSLAMSLICRLLLVTTKAH